MIECDEEYGAQFAEAGLLIAPGIAQMYTTGEIAAQLASRRPVSTRSTSSCCGRASRPPRRPRPSSPTCCRRGTTSSRTPYVAWEAAVNEVVVPGQHQLALALDWGGTSHPVWFKHDARVANCARSAACSTAS